MRYHWWAEFQKRGALHYHAIVVDAPFATEGEARRWFTDAWRAQLPGGVFRAQPDVQFKSAPWFRSRAGAYVLKDVRKLGGKHYQQDYTRMPRGWRTFRSHQLVFTAAEHELHETKAHTICVAPPDAPWYEKRDQVYVYRVDWHVPAATGCALVCRKQRRQRFNKSVTRGCKPAARYRGATPSDKLELKSGPEGPAGLRGDSRGVPAHNRLSRATEAIPPLVSNTSSNVA